MEQLGTKVTRWVHSTKVKNCILKYFLDLEAHSQGREIVFSFKQVIGHAVRKACEHDAHDDSVHLARAACILRRDMSKMKVGFIGSYDSQCQEKLMPSSLLAMVVMVLNHHPSIKEQSDSSTSSPATTTISQLLLCNSILHGREGSSGAPRHSQQRETPLLVYLGLMVHTKTHKRDLVDCLFKLGLCISYDRGLSILTDMGNKLCDYYEREDVVCPPDLKGGLFTTAAADKIDHNPSSVSVKDSFHGTGLTLFQHPSNESRGVQWEVHTTNQDMVTASMKQSLSKLPELYTTVPPLAL